MLKIDELKLYCGDDISITDKIIITQPTLNQIKDFGEQRYFNAVQTLTSSPADLKWQLWDMLNIDFTTISDYDLFIKLIHPLISSKKSTHTEIVEKSTYDKSVLEQFTDEDLSEMLVNPMELVLKDIDFAEFVPCKEENSKSIVLYNPKKDIVINEFIYNRIVEIVRKIHKFKRNSEMPANEGTKMIMIEDARDEAMAARNKEYKSILVPLISSLSAKTGQCGDSKIMDMKIYAFMDSIRRIAKIQDAELLLQGAYSGFSSLKGVDKSRLDWSGELD